MTGVLRIARWICFGLCTALACAPSHAAQGALPGPVSEALHKAGVAPAAVAIWV